MNNNVHCYFQDEDPNKNANMLRVQNDRVVVCEKAYFTRATISEKIARSKILTNPSQMIFLKSLHLSGASHVEIPSKHTPYYARIHRILLLCCNFALFRGFFFPTIPISQVFNFSGCSLAGIESILDFTWIVVQRVWDVVEEKNSEIKSLDETLNRPVLERMLLKHLSLRSLFLRLWTMAGGVADCQFWHRNLDLRLYPSFFCNNYQSEYINKMNE
ncbi:hypothetical protein MTR_6g036520 [Medicago truncatula]|uniref:Uncharacterized protein n=1 Tax=Medicago truncatula TaxID=3880 RepID=G7KHR3_MEDTR|nr:hypothetical protein MTR_6g036520 [Medicago truncatula]